MTTNTEQPPTTTALTLEAVRAAAAAALGLYGLLAQPSQITATNRGSPGYSRSKKPNAAPQPSSGAWMTPA